MAFIIKDRVKENTTSTGTGAVSLGGAAATFDTFQSYMSNGDTTYYAIVHTGSGTDEWEVGLGTWNTGNTLTRTTVLAGSNGTSAVNFSAGTKDVFMTYPASKAVYTDASGDIDINGGTIDGTTIGATTADTGKFTTLETTSNADIGGYVDLEVLSDHAAYKEGRIWYDNVHKTLNFYSDDSNVVHELGIEEHQRVYNNTGSTITKGSPLYFSGNYTAGTIDVPTVGLADATDVNAYNAQGLAASDIANNSYGYCIVAGQLTEVDTSGLNAGNNFFVGLTPGAVQNSSPVYPNFPMCLGWVVNSDANDGVLLVNQQNHSVNSFRVRTDAHIGDDLIVGGNLQVLGTTTTTSTSDVTAGAPFYRANEGDAIGEAGTTFSGTGLDDAFFAGHFTGTTATTYYVKIDSVGTPDTFAVSTDDFATTISSNNAITGDEQLIHSADNISVTFGATTGHTLNDKWTGTASPILVDSGFFTNRNTGTSGVGYTHMGFYYDVSEDKWVLLDEYDPTPNGAINLADASTSYATLKAGTFEGDLQGDVTGDVTGNASTADSLSTSRNIGGVAFNGTADINLPGVNTTGNQDTSGNAATATALETARTIQLTGDVTGSATFDGSANASITAVVQDDSHSHVISNVDGLQAALDGKADDTITITAGSGLTGGGDLSASRTLNVGAGGGITVSADAVAHADTSTQASINNSGNTFIQDVTLDTYGHVTGLTSSTVTVGDGDITVASGGGLTGSGTFSTNQSSNETITLSHADTSSQASVNGSGRTYIQDITLDGYGHVTAIGTATETVVNTNQLTTFQVEDGDGTEVTVSHGKEWKFVEAGGIDINWTDTTPGSDADPYDLSFSINTGVTAGNGLTGGGTLNANRTLNVGAGSGITVTADAVAHADTSTQASVNNSGRTYIQDITLDGFGHITGLTSATETVTDTTYSAGSGLSLSGTTFSHADTSSQASVDNSGNTVIQDVTLDTYGHVTGLTSKALSIPAAANNATITISAGGGLSTGGAFTTNQSTNETITIDHADTSTQSSVNNSGRTYIQDITLDGYGHVTGISSATETVTNTDTTYSAGSGLSLSGTTFSHSDTSSQASVNNSGSTFIQDITLDTYGHITGISSAAAPTIPSGVITLWSGSTSTIPSGWVLCDGNNSTPDLRDRFVVGAGSGYAVNATGGSSSVTLTTAQLPSHTHAGPSHSHTYSGTTSTASLTGQFQGRDDNSYYYSLGFKEWNGVFSAGNQYTKFINSSPASYRTIAGYMYFNGSHSHTFSGTTSTASGTTGAAGSGNSHENRPPYYALAYIMKT